MRAPRVALTLSETRLTSSRTVGMLRALLAVLVTSSTLSAQQLPLDSAFARLRAAYAARDARAAAQAYATDAEVRYAYTGTPVERYRGRTAITASFTRFFAGLPADKPLDLNFRFTRRTASTTAGVYRLRVGRESFYGRFAVRQAADGTFAQDVSTSATRDDFERAPGPVLFGADDEDLDPAFYDRLLGRYRTSDRCELVVTRSVVRLMVRDTCTQEWRGLSRVSGEEWIAASRTLGADTAARLVFVRGQAGRYVSLRRIAAGTTTSARRSTLYTTERVSFTSADGTRLAGTLYRPAGGGRVAAAVLVHGSGAQDRHGYASIIGVMADAIASDGRAALAFDKRGVGGSGGDWSRAGFPVLADDARAAMAYLASRADLDPAQIGVAGSSQAGWVTAAAIARGARPADVFLLGAAGTAFTVAEQNLYNTRILMQCDGIPASGVALALAQQSAFFDFLHDPSQAARLDSLTRAAAATPRLGDWLFPDARSVDRSAGSWYVTLDPHFDPRPVWRTYRGTAHLVFSEYDDATETPEAVARLRADGLRPVVLSGSQHLGLHATDRCHAGLRDVSRFSPDLFVHLTKFARRTP